MTEVESSFNPRSRCLSIKLPVGFRYGIFQAFRKSYENIKDPIDTYIVDMANQDFVDSSGLAMLLLLREYVRNKQAKIKILNCPSLSLRMLNEVGMQHFFAFEEYRAA